MNISMSMSPLSTVVADAAYYTQISSHLLTLFLLSFSHLFPSFPPQ